MEKTNWKKVPGEALSLFLDGKTHVCSIEDIIIEENAIERLPEILGRHDYKKLCIVCDINTKKVAGDKVCAVLDETAYTYQTIVFQDRELVPDEEAVTYFLTEIDRDCDLIIGVGSGTINDLCRFISYKMNLDYYIVGTAPSMDGYASNVSPLIIKHLKTTYEAHTAQSDHRRPGYSGSGTFIHDRGRCRRYPGKICMPDRLAACPYHEWGILLSGNGRYGERIYPEGSGQCKKSGRKRQRGRCSHYGRACSERYCHELYRQFQAGVRQ